MPKIKTHKATAKRFKLTGSGKLLRTRGEKRHLRRNRSKRIKRVSYQGVEVVPAKVARKVMRLAPYLSKQ
ncbi:MAG: 50S ribosomal protein L35 [Anaerolineae bacterium]